MPKELREADVKGEYCAMCLLLDKPRFQFEGLRHKQIHMKEQHKQTAGKQNVGRRGKPPKHWRSYGPKLQAYISNKD